MAEKASGIGALTTLTRFAAPRVTKHLLGGHPSPPKVALREGLTALLGGEAAATIACSGFLDLSVESNEWVDTGIAVDIGDQVTILGQGSLWMSKPLDIRLDAGSALWCRIGDGPLFKVTGEASSFIAEQSGPVYLIAAGPGVFETPAGDFLGGEVPSGPTGRFEVAILKWKNVAAAGLEGLASNAEGALGDMLAEAAEQARNPVRPPENWRYLWRLGEGALYKPASEQDDACIHCTTHEDVGILQIPAERPLTDTVTLNWDWIAHQLPSVLPEDIEPTHDYLSIAVEFDNGLDLTYMWSAALPEDTIFQCPLAWWEERETHWVIRTKKDIGKWLSEERSIRKDYERAIGGDVPAKIVQVWLIANSLFQRGTGKCDYRAIRLVDGDDVLSLC